MITIIASIVSKPLPYLDPGSGSILIQLAVGAVLGAGVLIRVFWKNIKAFFSGKKVEDDSIEDPTAIDYDDPTAIMEDDPTVVPPTKE